MPAEHRADDAPAISAQLLAEDVLLLRSPYPASPQLSRDLAAAAAALRGEDGIRDIVVAYREVAVSFDPHQVEAARIAARWRHLRSTTVHDPAPEREHRIAVHYDGPDLAAVAAAVHRPIAEIVRRHTQATYHVAAVGFVPDFPYLLGLDPVLDLPRRPEPRTRVPAGSVAIAAGQAGIYPRPTPGGWHLIGRCDPGICAQLTVGHQVRFEVASA